MTVHACIFAETPVQLWGLSSRERFERILKKSNITSWLADPSMAAPGDFVLLLRGDYLFDERLIRSLVDKPGTVLQTAETDGRPVAACVAAHEAPLALDFLKGRLERDKLSALTFVTPQTLTTTYVKNLLKIDPPYLLPITSDKRRKLENRLFSGSYKGVTDLVTKWLWPVPAQWVTGICARKGITPNQVTSLSLVLVVLAGLCFYHGFFALGLLAAWLMTFLDTVDGKLARVTVNSSQFGNLFDHSIDLISPPFLYLVWGLGLASWQPGLPLELKTAMGIIFGAYIAGRLVEGTFTYALEPSGVFCWQPLDSWFRLITGRRNPNLILLNVGLCAGRPDLGLVAVTFWTLVSSLFLLLRLGMAVRERIKTGPLRSWFLDIDPNAQNPSLTQRCFTTRRS
ncbi:MAG: CDP-alcohol phosphatidyltransferase family protein [Deltaproteobacteria bacterium]|nr:CDP-alcohol phosphatidyltransferase family protein [Deltaproteobacteria bacterium]